jgi:hypothetical protein
MGSSYAFPCDRWMEQQFLQGAVVISAIHTSGKMKNFSPEKEENLSTCDSNYGQSHVSVRLRHWDANYS